MKRILPILLIFALCLSGCVSAPLAQQEDAGCSSEYIENDPVKLTLLDGICYFTSGEAVYSGTFGKEPTLCYEDSAVIGSCGGCLFLKEGADILAAKDGRCQTLFTLTEEGNPYITAVAVADSRVVLFARNPAQQDLGLEFWYLDVDLSAMEAQRTPLSHEVTAALFHGDTFYYAQDGTLYAVPSAGGESKEIGAISRNSVELAVVGDVIAYYGTVGEVGAYRLGGEAVPLPFVEGGSGTFRLYGTVLVGWQKCYDLAAGREVKWEELPLYIETASGSAFLARDGLVFSDYDYKEKVAGVKAVVAGTERTATLPCDAPLDLVDAVFNETGVAVRTRDGKLYTALWN